MGENILEVDNITVNKKENYIEVSVNPRIFSLNVTMSAAYNFIDKANCLIDGDLREEIIVKLWPLEANGIDLVTLGKEFNTELVSESVLYTKSVNAANIRNALVNSAFTNQNKEQNC